jgi:hypothetical protein
MGRSLTIVAGLGYKQNDAPPFAPHSRLANENAIPLPDEKIQSMPMIK